MKTTHHSIDRGKQRLGLPPEPFRKLAQKALSEGIKHSETKGRLNKYLTSLFWYAGTANNLRIYGHFVYVFQNDVLITVLNLPNEFKDLVKKLKHDPS